MTREEWARFSTKRRVSIHAVDRGSAVTKIERYLAAVASFYSFLIQIFLADTQLNARLVVARYLGPTGHSSGGDFGEREAGILIKCAFSPRDGTKLKVG
jgi:hypothetical protein